jgi:hypothetical protein
MKLGGPQERLGANRLPDAERQGTLVVGESLVVPIDEVPGEAACDEVPRVALRRPTHIGLEAVDHRSREGDGGRPLHLVVGPHGLDEPGFDRGLTVN